MRTGSPGLKDKRQIVRQPLKNGEVKMKDLDKSVIKSLIG